MSQQKRVVTTEQHDKVLVVTMDRPEARNSLSRDLVAQIAQTLDEARFDDNIAAVVITGNGKSFCAGADITELLSLLELTPVDEVYLDQLHDAFDRFKKPLIAAVHGLAFGGGCEVVLSCDIAIAETSALFGMPEVKLGILAGGGGTQRLVHAIGKAKAMKMLLTAEPVDAQYAYEAGLIAEVTEDGKVLERAIEIGKTISHNAPLAVQLTADAARRAQHVPLAEGLTIERRNFQLLTKTQDAKHGIEAFLERKTPTFTGR